MEKAEGGLVQQVTAHRTPVRGGGEGPAPVLQAGGVEEVSTGGHDGAGGGEGAPADGAHRLVQQAGGEEGGGGGQVHGGRTGRATGAP